MPRRTFRRGNGRGLDVVPSASMAAATAVRDVSVVPPPPPVVLHRIPDPDGPPARTVRAASSSSIADGPRPLPHPLDYSNLGRRSRRYRPAVPPHAARRFRVAVCAVILVLVDRRRRRSHPRRYRDVVDSVNNGARRATSSSRPRSRTRRAPRVRPEDELVDSSCFDDWSMRR